MTPEEKAVIEAADRLVSHWEFCVFPPDPREARLPVAVLRDIGRAVAALRESRKPKPAWEPFEFGIRNTRDPDLFLSVKRGSGMALRVDRDRVLRLLNQDEERQ